MAVHIPDDHSKNIEITDTKVSAIQMDPYCIFNFFQEATLVTWLQITTYLFWIPKEKATIWDKKNNNFKIGFDQMHMIKFKMFKTNLCWFIRTFYAIIQNMGWYNEEKILVKNGCKNCWNGVWLLKSSKLVFSVGTIEIKKLNWLFFCC